MRIGGKLVVGFSMMAAVVVVLAVVALGAEFHVTSAGEFVSSLQAASNNGEDDVLILEAGTYQGNFSYQPRDGKTTTIRGAEGTTPSEVVLDGGGEGSVFTLVAFPEGCFVTLAGLTVQNGMRDRHYGGGIRVVSVSGTLELYLRNVIVQHNSAAYSGGGIGINPRGNSSTKVEIRDSIIRYNETPGLANGGQGRGGGIYAYAYKGNSSIELLVVNSLIYGNKANWTGGGIEFDASEVGDENTARMVLINTTVAGNVSDMNNRSWFPGGGIMIYGYGGEGSRATLELYNSIVWGNTATAGAPGQDIYLGARDPGEAELHADHCDLGDVRVDESVGSPIYEKNQVISFDPLFLDPEAGDFRLGEDSPCLDAGTADVSGPGLPGLDIDGNPRVCGAAPDLGPYERCGD